MQCNAVKIENENDVGIRGKKKVHITLAYGITNALQFTYFNEIK